jgi:hypothetical protein
MKNMKNLKNTNFYILTKRIPPSIIKINTKMATNNSVSYI